MERSPIKYEYRTARESQSLYPSIVLREGEIGKIQKVNLMLEGDYVRGERFSFQFTNGFLQEAFSKEAKGESEEPYPTTLEQCTDEQLGIVAVYHNVKGNTSMKEHLLSMEELEQIRELEIGLRQQMGEYRQIR